MPAPLLFVLDATGEVRAAAADAPLVPAQDLALLRGEGVFETMLVVPPLAHDAVSHLDRLAVSARAVDLGLPPRARLDDLLATAAGAWPAGVDGVLRLVVTKGTGAPAVGICFALVSAVPAASIAAKAGVHAITLTLGGPVADRAAASWLLPGVKSTSYAVPMAALRSAAAAGVEDAIWVSSDGEVLEAATANVAWVGGDGILVAPPPAEIGVLPGTTLAEVLGLARAAGIAVEERRGTRAELAGATEAMLTGSVRGVVPLLSLDRVDVGDGMPGPVTTALMAAHDRAVHGA